MLSIVIPTLNEATTLPALLADLDTVLPGAESPIELVVADGGSADETAPLAAAAGARLVVAPRGRGSQLRAGVQASRGEVIAAFHADVRIPRAAGQLLRAAALGDRRFTSTAWAFRLSIASAGLSFRLIESGANLRSRALGLPYGDQGLIIPRLLYDRAGGYPDVPLMEDVALASALRRLRAPIRLLPAEISVSPRRWQRDGVWRRTARNLYVLGQYLAGASPERLLRIYR
jgi:hypothetical protein